MQLVQHLAPAGCLPVCALVNTALIRQFKLPVFLLLALFLFHVFAAATLLDKNNLLTIPLFELDDFHVLI
jgi:hypothetical protein